jgi:hypothetical protein
MQTWLDAYAKGYRARARVVLDKLQAGAPHHDFVRGLLETAVDDDGFALKVFSTANMQTYDALVAGEAEFSLGMTSQILWQTNIARFVLELDRWSPAAAVLSADVVHALSGATLSQEIRQRGRAEAMRRRLTYLDIPHGALRIGEGMQVRALFIAGNQGPPEREQVNYTAILTPPGRNCWRRIGWTEDRDIIIDDSRTMADLRYALVCTPEPGNDFEEPLEQAARRAGVALQDVFEDLEAFALLALTYMGTAEEGRDDAPWPVVPHIPFGHPRRRGRNARQVAKKFSFFKAHRIGAVPGGFGRPVDREEGQGRALGRRTEVRGHFRLQPHGPRGSLRRLQWISPHMRGPRTGILSTNLVRLEAANEHGPLNEVA